MHIGIVAPSPVPFVSGGAEAFSRGLIRAFNERTPHTAELVELPVAEFTLPDLMHSYRSFSELDVSRFDMVISTKYPAWMVEHPNHIVYMLHKLRGLYDTYDRFGLPTLFGTPSAGVDVLVAAIRREGTPPAAIYDAFDRALDQCGQDHPWFRFPSPLAREMIHVLDRWGMSPKRIRKYMALSETVASRADYFPLGAPVEVVPLPPDLDGFHSGSFDYIFTASRLDAPKRLDMVVHAMLYVDHPVQLIIAGTGPAREHLRSLGGHDQRIDLRGWVTDDEKIALYANALVVPFVPLDEDMGLITQEAMLSSKPVVTTTDSGGAGELVRDGVNGLVCAPNPVALGAALSRLVANVDEARTMGVRALATARAVTWERLTTAMLRGRDASIALPPPTWTGRPRIVIVATYPVHTLAHGGALRCYNLYRRLLDRYDVHVVSLGDRYADPENIEIEPGMVETVVPLTESFLERERQLYGDVGMPISDMTAGALHLEVPQYLAKLRQALGSAAAVVLAHPYLLPAVRAAGTTVPMIYDAHNAEFAMKRDLLPHTPAGTRLGELVHHMEGAAVRESALTVACSPDDVHTLSAEFGVGESHFAEIPNGVDVVDVPFTSGGPRLAARSRWLDHHHPLAGRRPPEHIALFMGSWHPPNIEAVELILRLAPSLPEVVFVVAGSVGMYFKDWVVPPNVALVGRISETAKQVLLRAASVALNPMLSGGGSNLKILEYMAAGVPVVTTPTGARGLRAVAGTHHLAVGIEQFGSAIRDVLGDPGGADERAVHARRLVEEHYDWRLLGRRMAEILTGVTATAPASAPDGVADTLGAMPGRTVDSRLGAP